ncbi:MAG: TraR/DksA family transcriptional regulator [Ramlibacter sp.]
MSLAEIAALRRRQDADDALFAGDTEVEATAADMESRELEAVCAALQRVHGIGYGLCTDCDAPIPIERLRAEPQAMRCISCQTLRDT